MGYCDIAPGHPFHGPYHDREYGFPQRRETVLFERLALEINQAGLSWLTVLKKRAAFRAAFHGFNVDRVAAYNDQVRLHTTKDEAFVERLNTWARQVDAYAQCEVNTLNAENEGN